ncbi:hypothetical protein B9T11_05110 [Wohlfahrtiimonas chitiniclastica]|nr:hypothetical protein B9T11_05110 [Wohlfahrtiimonas chitiniclastica]
MRGHRVVAKNTAEIVSLATTLVRLLGLSHSKFIEKPELIIDQIASQSIFDLRFELIPDNEWMFPVNGLYDPVRREIKIPHRIWKQLSYKTKTREYRKRKMEALRVLLHELGHYFLRHEFRYFDEKSSPATREEDAEYQADLFADAMMMCLGLQVDLEQMSLF